MNTQGEKIAFSIKKKNAQFQHKRGSENENKLPFLSYQIVFLKNKTKNLTLTIAKIPEDRGGDIQ